ARARRELPRARAGFRGRRRALRLVRLLFVRGADTRHDSLLGALLQSLAAPLDGGKELVEVHLERGEDRISPILHLQLGLPRLPASILDDLLGLPFGQLDDLGLRSLSHGLLARLPEDAVALALGLGQHFLALLDDPPR